jgi:hypothetical protein
MRWQSRLAIGALIVLPSVRVAGAAVAGDVTASTPRAHEARNQSVAAHRSAQSAVVSAPPYARRTAPALRPVVGDIRTNAPLTLAAWVLVGIIAARILSVWFRLAPRGRAPPLRFL